MARTDIRLALPSKGRLEQPALEFLAAAGLRVDKPNPRQYFARVPALPELTVMFQRPGDIVVSVREGSVDFGLAGLDAVEERRGEDNQVMILHEALRFGSCALAIAVPEDWPVQALADLPGYVQTLPQPLRMATQYPNLTGRFLRANGLSDFKLITAEGTLEVAPVIGYADAIADLVSSGQTLRDNRLRVLADGYILRSQAVFFANRAALRARPEVLAVARQLLEYLEAYLRGQENYVVLANMRGDTPQAVAANIFAQPDLAGLNGPTISPVYTRDGTVMHEVTIVVHKDRIIPAVKALRAVGGSGVIVTPATYIFEEEPERARRLNEDCDRSLLRRQPIGSDAQYAQPVAEIVEAVRTRGDAALREYTARFDRVTLDEWHVRSPEKALDLVAPEVLAALRAAAERLEAFHRHQPLTSWMTTELGGVLGQMVSPLARVGCYVPGGTAPLPSTVLHTVTLARVAGVKEIVVATPPNPDFPDTEYVNPVILAAAVIAGATEIVRVGGAQAIAALAYGTDSIRPVVKIVGPGNIYVTLAKKLVYGVVGIDGLAGPTETVVVADAEANPAWVAADLLAQAEHDVLASAILLTPSEPLAHAVQAEVARQIENLTRAGIITQTFDRSSGIVLTKDLAEAVALADEYAPEHLCLAVRDPWAWAPSITHAGGLFLGEHSFEVLGDYVAGPSHVMPTGGSARFASPLSVVDFVRLTSIVALDAATTARIAPQAATLARAEQLDAHANAAQQRIGDQ